eukprot:CAMPEP_0170178350 /NCGR_PEP_ID=MMETSP0040_2-20121228/11825_1 /TAXON_ID=641309 /ORGANISM="Lotharella oceanica, Strain CCMP622" /LENGTH=203 /DNA_ID=CAMNT_0010421383 /DNA_START=26 /DNA_END=637 /DNA_ORIENTATION=+
MESVAILSPQLYASLQTYRKSRYSTVGAQGILPLQFGNLKRRRETREQKAKPVGRVRGTPPPAKSRKLEPQAQRPIYPNPMIYVSKDDQRTAKPEPRKPELKEGAYGAMLDNLPADTLRSAETAKSKLGQLVSGENRESIPRTDSWKTSLGRDESLSSDYGLPSEDDIDLLFDESFDVTSAIRNVVNDDLKSSFSCPDSVPLY